jgi:hypothetical protein
VEFCTFGKFEIGELEAQEDGPGRADPKPPDAPATRNRFPGTGIVRARAQRDRIRDAKRSGLVSEPRVIREPGGQIDRRQRAVIDFWNSAQIVDEALGRRGSFRNCRAAGENQRDQDG